ncbi:MAG: M18 family aminopeptidase, partial [Spirochaetales bacterium]|nr:M18 family aminopeptidase [Spirochaetales bacterium]
LAAGYIQLKEGDAWDLQPGGKYLVTRQDSSVIGFHVGTKEPADSGFRIAAAHTDSPGFRLKTETEDVSAGALRVTAEVYGGPILSSWLDRDLSIAGRVVFDDGGKLASTLFNAFDAVAVIPSVAIHLNREVNKGIELNAQEKLRAVLSVSVDEQDKKGFLKRLIGKALGIDAARIHDADLYLFSAEPARLISGEDNMYVSGRIDNLGMSHAVMAALCGSSAAEPTCVAALFDSEEIGSMTWQGAQSSFLRDLLHRISLSFSDSNEDFFRALAHSSLISADAAHAVHPNYADKHDSYYVPNLNGGPVVKANARQSYTTTAESGERFIKLCKNHKIPVQKFIGRSDIPSGGTIGPITSASLGIPSVDIGNPIWGMHSIRETAGTKDQPYMVDALKAFFQEGLN